MRRSLVSVLAAAALAGWLAPAAPAAAQSAAPDTAVSTVEPPVLTADEVRREIVGLPLCGTPESGPLMGKPLCTVLLPDGTAAVAGAGILVRGVWEMDGDKVCRRSVDDPMQRRRCVSYGRLETGRYRNSDGVEFCIGPCS